MAKIAGNISSRSGMMRKSLENAQKRSNYLAFVFTARAAGRGAGPSSWLRRGEREKKREIPECKSEFFTASSAAAEFVVGARALLVVLVLLKSRSFPVNLFGRGVIYGAVAPTRTSPAVGVESFSIKWLKDTSVVSIYKKPQ